MVTHPAVAQPGLIHPALWKGQALHQTPGSGISSSFRLLDRELPGNGWPRGTLTELLVQDLGIGELRFLAPTLRGLTQSGQHVVLLTPPHIPYAPAFAAMGIDHTKILVVHAKQPVDRLWAVEQSIKSKQFGALITWLDDSKAARPELLRRLQLAASSTQGLVFVFRPFAAQDQPSPAPLRMRLLPRRYPDLAVQIIKRRGPVMSSPIDIAIPIPGSGLRPLEDHEAIIAAPTAAPTRQTAHHHAVDRMRHSPSLSGALSSAAATHSPTARR
ncbi:MAG: translesion DNA synthesis-associated protein ImuA [Burkholderiaceae bacterium]|nr:translesion DNA synthesis-associated protein ImuA [Burkholderiaceae bacterium]